MDFPPMGMTDDGTAEGVEPQLGTGREVFSGRQRKRGLVLGRENREKGRALGGSDRKRGRVLEERPEEGWPSGRGRKKAGGLSRRVRKKRRRKEVGA